jgi:TPR repeat protein
MQRVAPSSIFHHVASHREDVDMTRCSGLHALLRPGARLLGAAILLSTGLASAGLADTAIGSGDGRAVILGTVLGSNASASQLDDATTLVGKADALMAKSNGRQDPVAAFALYQQAAALGDRTAKLRMGEALIKGRGTPANPAAGLAILTQMGDAGDSGALLLLGDFYAKGAFGPENQSKAIDAYTRAAARGRSLALVLLGDLYRTGRVGPADPLKAAAYYRDAIAAGRSAAAVPLGLGLVKGDLKGAGSVTDGFKLLRQADAGGIPAAAIALSDCYLYGLGVKADAKQAVKVLDTALDRGNLAAGQRLVAIYRDGRPKLIVRDLAMARRTLRKIEGQMSPADRETELFLLKVSQAKGRQRLAQVSRDFAKMPPAGRQSLVRQISSVNQSAYVYLVQARLADLGLYGGRATGVMSPQTEKAVVTYCQSRETSNICSKGPMTAQVTEVMVTAF